MNNNYDELVKMLEDKRDWRVRVEGIKGLAEIATYDAMEAITSCLYDESPHVVHAASKALEGFGGQAVEGLLRALNSPEPIADRRMIIFSLGQIADYRALPDLITLLDDADHRLNVASALANLPDKSALPKLLQLLEIENEQAKHVIAETLGAIKHPDSIPALRKLLYSPEQGTKRASALALGKIDAPEALDALLEATSNPNAEVRSNATEGLQYKYDQRAFDQLVKLLEDPQGLVRAMATKSLAKVDGEKATPYLISMLNDSDHDVQNSLHWAMGYLTGLDIIPVLMSLYREGKHNADSGLYLFAMKRWDYETHGEEVVYQALGALESDNQNLRIAAVWFLYVYNGKLETELRNWKEAGKKREDFEIPALHAQVLDKLTELLIDENPDVRLSAIEPILRTGNARAVENLIDCLRHSDSLVVKKAADALIHIGDQRATPELLKLLISEDREIRLSAVYTLGFLGGEGVFDGLVTMLDDPDNWIQNRTIYALGRLGDKRATPLLLERLLKETDKDINKSILFALGELRDKHATPTLTEILNAPYEKSYTTTQIRYYVTYALTMIRDEAALPTLYDTLNSDNEIHVYEGAVNAIGATGTPLERADRLFQLLEHKNDTARTVAARNLGYLGARTEDLDLRDYIVSNLIKRMHDTGTGYHGASTVGEMAAKSLYFVGTTEAIAALKAWEESQKSDDR